MAIFTPRSYATHLRSQASKKSKSAQIGHQAAVADIRQKAVELVSGTLTKEDEKRLGHPYARRHRTPLLTGHSQAGGALSLNPLPINAQTRKLLNSLRVFRRTSGDSVYYQLQFTDPKAKFVLKRGGTAHVRDRGYWEAVQAYAGPVLRSKVSGAFHSA